MSHRSEHLDRVVLRGGREVTVWCASWPRQSRLERSWEAAQAVAYHYRRAARYIVTGRH